MGKAMDLVVVEPRQETEVEGKALLEEQDSQ
jgi:hypothetical protein